MKSPNLLGNLFKTGRIFYGIAIAGIGYETIYSKDLPYILLPPEHSLIPILTYISGALFILIGVCIVFDKKARPVSLLFGSVLVLIFCFFYIPYEFTVNSNYLHLAEWENAEKEMALAGGAFVIAGHFSETNDNYIHRVWEKLVPYGVILFCIPIVSFGILHFLYTKEASTLVPSWIPHPIFWTYFAGTALIGSGVLIILQIRRVLIATLLGAMIFIWFIIIHVPRVILSSSADSEGEVTSAFLALAYSATAFVIAGTTKKRV